MKLLAIGNYYEPEVTSGIYLVKNLYEQLAEDGVEVDVVIPSPSRGISDETALEYFAKNEILKEGRLRIHRVKIYPEGKGVIKRALRYGLLQFKLYKEAKKIKADIVFAQSTPPIIGITAAKIAKKKHIPFVYNLHDVFPDSMVNAGMTHEGSIIFKIGRKIENYVYKNANRIIAVSNGIKENVINKGVNPDKVAVISNWVDDDVHSISRENNVLIDRWKLDPAMFYVVYAGNLGTSQNIDVILDAAKLTEEEENIQYLIIGNGADEERLIDKAISINLRNVAFYPMQPYKDVSYVYSLGDVDVVTCKAGVGKTGMPSKTWSIMVTGRPIIACFDENSELWDLITNTETGLCGGPDDAKTLADNILFFYNNQNEQRRMGHNGKQYILDNLSKRVCVSRYFEEIINVMI